MLKISRPPDQILTSEGEICFTNLFI